MIPNLLTLDAHLKIRASLVLCTGFLFGTLALVSSGSAEVSAPVVPAGETLALDPAVFGSSAGQASIKAAPTVWSSRSDVRWNARWTTTARYLA